MKTRSRLLICFAATFLLASCQIGSTNSSSSSSELKTSEILSSSVENISSEIGSSSETSSQISEEAPVEESSEQSSEQIKESSDEIVSSEEQIESSYESILSEESSEEIIKSSEEEIESSEEIIESSDEEIESSEEEIESFEEVISSEESYGESLESSKELIDRSEEVISSEESSEEVIESSEEIIESSEEITESSEYPVIESSEEVISSESQTTEGKILVKGHDYVKATSIEEVLEKKKVLFVARANKVALTPTNKGNTDYYKVGYPVSINDGRISNLPTDLSYWNIEEIDGKITIENDGNYLLGKKVPKADNQYYYNLGMSDEITDEAKWNYSSAVDNGFYLYTDEGVYIEYYGSKGSFTGYWKETGEAIIDFYVLEDDYWVDESSLESSELESSEHEHTSTDDYYTGGKEYWESISLSSYGSDFMISLRSLINKSGSETTSYSSLGPVLEKCDKDPTNPNKIVPFYHEAEDSVTPNWNSNINKEHTWPNSRGAGKTGPGSDPQIIRPTLKEDNSSRGNKMFGVGYEAAYDPMSCDNYEECRGECARIIFYAAARYEKLSLTNNPSDSASNNTMGILNQLLEWNMKYPVTQMEIQRNEVLDELGFARNPFIDNPDFVNYIWDANGIRTTKY